MNCPIHSVPFRTVPAGVSKSTGRPYNAFEACPERGCKEKPPKAHGGYTNHPTPPATPSVAPGEVVELLTRIAVALERISNKDLESVPF